MTSTSDGAWVPSARRWRWFHGGSQQLGSVVVDRTILVWPLNHTDFLASGGDMSDISSRLEAILSDRKKRAAMLVEHQERWAHMTSELNALAIALAELSRHPNSPPTVTPLASRLADQVRLIDGAVSPRLSRVARRFNRGTLNIGVGGRARTGKSTFLQVLSGLREDQIPTGDANAVTAVRSRIFHTQGEEYAEIRFHSWDSFRRDLLAPYFDKLDLGMVPSTLEEFRRFTLPPPPSSTMFADAETRHALWDRLSDMHRSIDGYAPFLDGSTRRQSLHGLRAFVAYPTSDEQKLELAGTPARRCYLAVQEAAIYCRFPAVDVSRIGIIDLPGTGEIVAGGENRHVADLKDEVDFVIQLCNPARYPMWGIEDARTLELVKESRCGAEPRDFCWILLNTATNAGPATEEQLSVYEMEVKKKVTGYPTRRVNARDPDSVRDDALVAALEHLANQLPEMDRAALDYATQGISNTASNLLGLLKEVDTALRIMPPITSMDTRRRELARELKNELGSQLHELLVDLADRVQMADTSEFEAAVQDCDRECSAFLEDGLGRGRDAWLDHTVRELRTTRNTGTVAGYELDRLRAKFSRTFSRIDNLLTARIEELHRRVAQIISEQIPLDGATPRAKLEALLALISETGSDEAAETVRELLDLRISYRSHFHPHIRRAVVDLEPETDTGRTQTKRGTIDPVAFDRNGAEELLDQLENLGHKVIGVSVRELHTAANLPDIALYAAGEQFADGLMRSGRSSDELFYRLADAYYDRIWPTEFGSLDAKHRLFKKCSSALVACMDAAKALEGV